MSMNIVKIGFIALLFSLVSCAEKQQILDISGNWEVSLDSMNSFQPIQLPGTTDMAGLGVANELEPALKKPQLLHLTRKHAYIGQAWYKRTVLIPEHMANRPLTLTLERVLWQSRLWIDGVKHSAEEESLTTPHQYYIAEGLKAGEHEFLLCIDNRKRYDISTGELAHAYTEDTQVKWNGVLGKMELKAETKLKIHQIDAYPDVKNKQVKVLATLVRTDNKLTKGVLETRIMNPDNKVVAQETLPVSMDKDTLIIERVYSLGENILLWNEFTPELYTLDMVCRNGEELDKQEEAFGMREISGKSGFLTLNGNRVFLRGTLECCIFPLTGTPPTDEAGWEKVFCSAKEWGLNHLRFHSWCPPEAAFIVADRMGFYLQVELPNWSLTVGRNDDMNRFLYDEYDRIIAHYGNHPSFCMLSVGNELQPDFTFLNSMVKYMKEQDNRHLYTATTFTFERGHGSYPEPEDEFFITQWTNKGWIRGQGVFDAEQPNFNKDYHIAADGIDVPLISHEIGQYAVYPNLKEIDKYTGTLDPLNFKAIKKDLEEKGLLDKADDYLMASGKLAALLYKEEIERAMKTPQFSGFQLLDLHDFPGQGTALVGLLDAFWDSKGVTDASSFRQFCAPIVPLARFDKAVYSNEEIFKASVEVANYSESDILNRVFVWSLSDETGTIVKEGKWQSLSCKQGEVTEVGILEVDLKNINKASRLILQVSIEGTVWKNSWSIWVYPILDKISHQDVVLTTQLMDALEALKQGKKVLLSPKKEELAGLEGKFLPVFWSPVHFPKQAGTMGLLCNPKHAALACFPTDMHSDWQWWNLVKNARVMVMDSIETVTPIVEAVDNFTNNRRLATIFEAKYDEGKLLMSSMELLSENKDMPEVRQLLYSLLSYMQSDAFAPTNEITEQSLHTLFLANGVKVHTAATSVYE